MSEFPTDALYSEEHEYLLPSGEDGVYTIGITDYAQGELGDVVFVELPDERDKYAPLEVNTALNDDPSLVNSDPYGTGWMVKLRVTSSGERDNLMGSSDYEKHIGK